MAINVLLVDDRPDNLLALEAVLQESRYCLVKARSGAEALEALSRIDFAVILLDVQMPQMDGFETARRIKATPRLRDIPIIFITAINSDPMHVFRGYDSGAIDYLMKPFDDYVLRSKVAVVAELYEKNIQIKQQQEALFQTNLDLQKEIREREHAEAALRVAHRQLEQRVRERTAALAASNDALQMEIAERKRAEEKLQTSLWEKEVLLKEIHHRVKNNLQIVSSLLTLQSHEVKDAHTRSLFQDSQDRIRSMALVHEALYQSKDLARIDMEVYIRRLSDSLLQTYGLSTQRISVHLRVEEGFFGIDTAIPCGLILNELMSNALKHAFRERRDGQITVELFPETPGRFLLTVQDNGVGLPPGFNVRQTRSLGLHIVDALVQQLSGALELQNHGGARFMVRFPLSRKPNTFSERSAAACLQETCR